VTAIWTKGIRAAADPERAARMVEALQGVLPKQRFAQLSTDEAGIVTTVFGGSEALGNQLIKHPDWLQVLDPEKLKFGRRKQGIRAEAEKWLGPMLESLEFSAALNRLREFKQRELLRIAARDLVRLDQVSGITQELSDVADVCLDGVWRVCYRQLTARHGQPWGQDPNGRWMPVIACVLGMGKLGGQELNYSSDVDVLFVYSEEGGTFKQQPARNQKPALSNHQFFNRLAEAFIAEVGKLTDAGTLYRIDLRLRPEGESGPLARSLASYENYYAQWGQTWERMMLIKARGVAGDAGLAAEFLETIQPFRYPRSISEGVLTEVGALKDRIESEVVGVDRIETNVKLGRGGIREIEFIAQALQLLHGGRQPFLQGAQTLPALQKLAQYELLAPVDAKALGDAYIFLRDVEHRLQMESNLQTHTIPANRHAQERLARLMGFATLKQFSAAHGKLRDFVAAIFDKVLRAPGKPGKSSDLPQEFEGREAQWKQILSHHRFRDADKALRMLREFVEGPGYVHVSPRTRELALKLLPRLFSPSHALSDPDRVVTRLDTFIAAYGARATMFELWNSNPAIFDLLVLLFDRSEFLAELAIRTPDLVDELVTSGRIRQRKTAAETLQDLRHGLADKDQHLWLRRYHQAELMRIGLRDILGLADEDQYLTELSALADACLQYALEVVMRQNKLRSPPICIIGLGKLGGAEIDYGSDLDIIFVAAGKAKDLAKLSRLAVQVMDLVSKRTEQGTTFQTDARLRPDGEKGLLVNSIEAYEQYYLQRALLWELQALTRTRVVAGDVSVGEKFQAMAARVTNFSEKKDRRGKQFAAAVPVAFTPGWKRVIHDMRMRIEKERTPGGKGELAIKTGSGGLMDAEFLAQTLCLENGWQEPNTLRALERGRDAGFLPQAKSLIENYCRLRRVEGILRRWSYEGETVLPDDPAPYYRVAVRCGFENSEAFRKFLADCRKKIRKAYLEVFRA